MSKVEAVLFTIFLLSASLLSGCEKPISGVNIHGLNYSADTFSYNVVDPVKPDEFGGGELVDPFGAGGTTCCVTLPDKWRPEIKLLIHTTHWLPQRSDGSLPEVKDDHLVEVPPYVDGKPGELWVLRAVDGSVSVISSDFQPDHPRWPGKIKGWLVPSLEYQRERWEIVRKHEEETLDVFVSLLDELDKNPQMRAKHAWEFTRKNNPSNLVDFSGPNDPRYWKFLRKRYEDGLERSQQSLNQVMEEKP